MLAALTPLMAASRRAARGLGLIELMVATVVLGVIVAVAAPSLRDLLERRRIAAVAGELANIFAFARSEANVNADQTLVLHMENDPSGNVSCVALTVLHPSDAWKCYQTQTNLIRAILLRLFLIPASDNVSFQTTATQWGLDPNRMYFVRNRPDTSVSGVAITITGRRTGAQLRLEYNQAGRVHTCSPHGTMGGYPVCS